LECAEKRKMASGAVTEIGCKTDLTDFVQNYGKPTNKIGEMGSFAFTWETDNPAFAVKFSDLVSNDRNNTGMEILVHRELSKRAPRRVPKLYECYIIEKAQLKTAKHFEIVSVELEHEREVFLRENTKLVIFVMEKLPTSAKKFIDKIEGVKGKIRETLKIFRGICDCLRDLHGAGISHGDLTMKNWMLRGDNSVVLIDFGNSRMNTEIDDFVEDYRKVARICRRHIGEIRKALEYKIFTLIKGDFSGDKEMLSIIEDIELLCTGESQSVENKVKELDGLTKNRKTEACFVAVIE